MSDHIRVPDRQETPLSGQFSLLAVTTLEKLLLRSELGGRRNGTLKLLAIEERPMSLIRGFAASDWESRTSCGWPRLWTPGARRARVTSLGA